MSRWERWTTQPKQGMSLSGFIAEQQSPAEMAQSMGLQSDGSGGYVDESGNVVARTVNNELVFYDPMGGAISAQSDGAALTQAQPSWRDPVTGEITVPPGQAESPEEIAAIPDIVPAQAPASYNAFMNKKKKEMYANQAPPEQEAVDDIQQEADPEMGMQPEMGQGMAMGMGEEILTYEKLVEKAAPIKKSVDPNLIDPNVVARSKELKLAQARNKATAVDRSSGNVKDDFQDAPTLDAPKQILQKPTQEPIATPQPPQIKDYNGDGKIDQEELRKSALEAYQGWQTPKINAERRMETRFAPMLQALNGENVNPELRARLMQTMIGSMKYEGRDNEASSDLSKAEFQALQENKDRILKGYGGEGADGSAHNFDAIRQFQKEMNDPDLDEDLLKAAFDALPPDRQKIYKGGDMSAWQGFKKFASQRGKGGYTGMDLDMNTMQMEHFIDNSQSQRIKELTKKEKRDMSPEEKELVDFIRSEDNQFWSRQSPNEQKSARNIQDFFGQRVDPLDELGEDFFDFREMQLDPARLDLKGKEKGYIQNIIDTDDDGNISLQEMDEAGFGSHMDSVNQIYDNQKKDLLEALTQKFDTKSLLKMGPKAFEKALADEKSDVSEEDRSRYDMLRNLQGKVKGYNSSFEKRIAQALGIPTGFIQSERARTNGASPEIYKAAIKSLVGKSKEEQKAQIEKIKKVFGNANSTANKQRGQGNTDADIKKVMYQTLFQGGSDEGLFSDELLENNPGLKKLRDKFMAQSEGIEEMIGDDEEMGFEMEDILEIIKQMMSGESKKTFDDFKNQQ